MTEKLNLYQQAATATRWSGLFSLLEQGVAFATSITLLRLLSPSDYGIYAIVLAVTGFFRMFQDAGIGASLIQREHVDREHFSAAFWGMLILGGALCLLMALLTVPVARFYGDNRLISILLFVSLLFVINALTVVPRSLIFRDLNFKALGIVTFSALVISSTVMIVMALNGYGVWSLAVGAVAQAVLALVFYCVKTKWLPSCTFHYAKLKDLLGFGLQLSGSKFMAYGRKNADYLIIGRILGPVLLGYYTFVYKLITEPVNRICGVLFKVVFPVFARAQNETDKLKKGYLLSSKYIMAIVMPLSIGIALMAQEIVPVIFGEKWIPAIPLVQIMAVMGLFEVLQDLIVSILNAKGDTRFVLRFTVVQTCLLVSAILIVVKQGILAVGVVVMFMSLASFIYLQSAFLSKVNTPWRLMGINAWTPAVSAAIMAFCVFGIKTALIAHAFSPAVVLAACVSAGVCVYCAVLYMADRKMIKEGWRIFFPKKSGPLS